MRRWYIWLSISAVLFVGLLWQTRPWDALATGADPVRLLAAVAINGVVIAMWAFRSQLLMRAVGHGLGIRSLLPVVSFANTINNLTPASSGEAVRAVILRRRHGVPYGRSTAVIVVERLWAIWIMAVSAGAAAVGAVAVVPPAVEALAWLAALAAMFAPAVAHRIGLRPAAAVARLVDRNPTDAPAAGKRGRLAALLRDVDAGLAEILASPGVSLGFVGTTGVVFATTAVQLWLILLSLGHEVSLVAAWAALGTATIAGVLSALPFGLGAADVVMAALLATVGVPAAAAGAAALLLRATVTLPLGLAGTASWIALNRGADRPTSQLGMDGQADP